MDKDTGIIKHIIGHIENIINAQKRFGSDFKIFVSDKDYFNSVCMGLLQIGELARHLSTEFTTVTDDLPKLYDKCKAILSP
jgi:uncharacterized protein with HEPN domain